MDPVADIELSLNIDLALQPVRELRQQSRVVEALKALEALEPIYPASGRLFEERGHCERARGERTAAIVNYQRAVDLNDALAQSWNALTELHRSLGNDTGAEAAAGCAARLAALPPPLAHASNLLNEGDIEAAESIIRGYLQKHGVQVEGMRLLAQIGIKLGVLDDAEQLLEGVLDLQPNYHDARYEYAVVLSERRRFLLALLQMRTLLGIEPANRLYRTLYAKACDGLGEHDEALKTYRQLLAESSASSELQLAIAHVLKTRGDQQTSIDYFRAASGSPSTAAGAFSGLSNLKTYRFSDGEIAQMRAAEAAPSTSLADRYHLCFALGKAFEDRASYAESFEYYARGNALKKSEFRYKAETLERTMRLQPTVCTEEFFAVRAGCGCVRPDPIFVVGLPRAGSTLIEQILASHSQVDGTLELPDIPRLVHRFRDRDGDSGSSRYPAILAQIGADELRLMGEEYLHDTAVYRRGAPFFVDKMPSNFRDIGLIHLILPNAKIIDARREPMACCFGNFKQLFTNGQEFKYSLEDIGRYYCNYVELMDHWDRVLPGKILRVQHEDVVNDLESSVRRLLEFCGLPFELGCLEFYNTARSVRTVSSEQVRRPIFREGLNQWRNYEPWLGPLKAALAPLRLNYA